MKVARSTLQMFCDTLNKAHVSAIVVSRMIGADRADDGTVKSLLAGEENVDKLGGVLSLEVQGW